MDKGIVGTGEGFDAASAGKVGGRWCNPSQAELKSVMLKVWEPPICRPMHFESVPCRGDIAHMCCTTLLLVDGTGADSLHLQAAERRAQQIRTGPQRLGGQTDGSLRNMTPAQVTCLQSPFWISVLHVHHALLTMLCTFQTLMGDRATVYDSILEDWVSVHWA